MKIDAKSLLKQIPISEIIGRHVHLKKRGAEMVGCCPFHADEDPSLNVNDSKGVYFCGPCGAAGDGIDFLMRLGRTFHEAVAEVGGETAAYEASPERRSAKTARPNSWRPILPVPVDAPEPPMEHYRHGRPSRVWAYPNEDGELLGYVCRFETPSGKETLPLVFATNDTYSEWRWQGFPKPRPLYNLPALVNMPDATVVVVEGEKTAEAAAALLPTSAVVSWIGGANGVGNADWTPLHGRKLLLWPDNDWQGTAAMIHVAEILGPHCPQIGWINNPEDAPKHWDVADAEWPSDETRRYVRHNIGGVPAPETTAMPGQPHALKWWNLGERWVYATPDGFHNQKPVDAPEIQDEQPPAEWDDYEPSEEPPAEPEPTAKYAAADIPFRPLGYNKNESGQNVYFIYSYKAQQVLFFKAGGFNSQSLIQLADLKWWEHRFIGKRSGISIEAAAEFLTSLCYKCGVYDPDNIRGIGAWIDERRVVVHAGTHLVCGGAEFELKAFDSRHIYEANRPFGFTMREPLQVREANRLMELLELMNWERPVNAHLFAGWAIIAPVCGALPWRPHIWLTGGKGTGKTTAVSILKQLIGRIAIHVQGNTSEAGIRQQLQHDARPVLFDEADTDGRNDTDRLQTILALVRSSSSFEGGSIVKGGQTGNSKTYRIKSCFAFASISPQVSNAADKSRVTLLSLVEPADKVASRNRWEQMLHLMGDVLTEEWCERLQGRTIQMLPVILENAKVFTRAAAAVLEEQRAGDQIGTLLAGAYSLFSNGVITYEDAVRWVGERDWSEIKSTDKDEVMLLSHLMEQQVMVETGHGNKYERSVGELVIMASHSIRPDGEFIEPDIAQQRLRRLGMKVEGDSVVISNTAAWIKSALKDTPYAKGHNKLLMRLTGAENVGSTKFASGIQTRAVKVPLEYLK